MIEIIKTIVNPVLITEDDNRRLEDFFKDLSKKTFRPLPCQFRTLSIIGALERWSDLKTVVRRQLSDAITSNWASYEDIPQSKSEETVLTAPVKTNSPDATPALSTEQTINPKPAPFNSNKSTTMPQMIRRDWFDMLLDLVGALIKPVFALTK